jgi:hypothetical protein
VAHGFLQQEVAHPTFTWYASFVRDVVLPKFGPFAVATFVTEVALGAALVLGLFTRLAGVGSLVWQLNIAAGAWNVPGEWPWIWHRYCSPRSRSPRVVLDARSGWTACCADGLQTGGHGQSSPCSADSLPVAPTSEAGPLRTDTSKALVPLDEIIAGGPPPDGIPAIDRPSFVTPVDAAAWLVPKEPVLALEIRGDARAYPLQILMWHEIVNDVVGGVPVAVTFCPLCNSGIVFERIVDSGTLDFGTSGKLYKSDLVMYDRQTHSLWAQMEGRAIVGARAGTKLRLTPANTLSFEEWRTAHPAGKVLSRDTGHMRSYGVNPYESYDEPRLGPFLFRGRLDSRRPPKERVVGVKHGEAARAYPWPVLAERRVVHDRLADHAVVVFYQPGALSALAERQIKHSRAVGATSVFSPVVDRRTLTFEAAPDGFRDRETGSTWNLLGHAVKGALAGRRLTAIAHVDAFWFAWAAFNPSTSVYGER